MGAGRQSDRRSAAGLQTSACGPDRRRHPERHPGARSERRVVGRQYDVHLTRRRRFLEADPGQRQRVPGRSVPESERELRWAPPLDLARPDAEGHRQLGEPRLCGHRLATVGRAPERDRPDAEVPHRPHHAGADHRRSGRHQRLVHAGDRQRPGHWHQLRLAAGDAAGT